MKKLLIIVFIIFFSKESFADSIKEEFSCTIEKVCQKDLMHDGNDIFSLCIIDSQLSLVHENLHKREFKIFDNGRIEIRGWGLSKFDWDIQKYPENNYQDYHYETYDKKYIFAFRLSEAYHFQIQKNINGMKKQIHYEEGFCEKN